LFIKVVQYTIHECNKRTDVRSLTLLMQVIELGLMFGKVLREKNPFKYVSVNPSHVRNC